VRKTQKGVRKGSSEKPEIRFSDDLFEKIGIKLA